MQQERHEGQARLKELNEQFLQEIENGKGWSDVKDIMEEMKEIAKKLDNLPAQVVSFDNYPLEQSNKQGTGK